MYDHKEYQRKWRRENQEKLKAYQEEYRSRPENKEKQAAYNDQYRKDPKNQIRIKKVEEAYKEKNRALRAKYGDDYREKNRDEINRKQRERREQEKAEFARKMEDGVMEVMDIRYKIGAHDFVYYECEGEWVRSTIAKKQLEAMVRAYG